MLADASSHAMQNLGAHLRGTTGAACQEAHSWCFIMVQVCSACDESTAFDGKWLDVLLC